METHAPKAVFLSYAREDATAARRIAEALRSSGIEVWFDENELRGGDAWDQKIRRQIRDCTLFLAIISTHTQERGEGYFRLEWNLAVERTRLMMEGIPFLVPVVVDETSENMDMVPESFARVQWTRLPGALPTPQFVEQVKRLLESPRKPVAAALSTGQPKTVSTLSTSEPETASVAPRRFALPGWAWGALVAVLVLSVAAWFAGRRSGPAAAPQPGVTETKPDPIAPVVSDKSIAVLPFDNQSEDKDANAFFSDGIHEDILTNLAHIRELRVVSRTSVMEYRGKTENIRQIAQKLGVAYVLEGSVRRVGNKVRVTGQLIRAATDEHVWAETYDKDLTDIFAIQSELAQKIAASLQAALSPQEKNLLSRRPTENLAAYDSYLKALAERRNVTNSAAGLRRQESLLQAAVSLDRDFAAAWGELAIVHIDTYFFFFDHTPARIAKAKVAIDTAIRLAPDSPEVIRAVGDYYFHAFRDYLRATAEYEKLIRLQPNDPNVYSALGFVQRRQGRWNEAIANFRTALRLDPGDYRVWSTGLVSLLAAGRRHDELVAARRRLVELRPDNLSLAFQVAYDSLQASGSARDVEAFFAGLTDKDRESSDGRLLRRTWAEVQGNTAEAIRLDEWLNPNGNDSLESAVLYAAHGDVATASAKLKELPARLRARLELEPDNATVWGTLGRIEAVLGYKEEALRCALKAVELMPESGDAFVGPPRSADLAFVNAWTGDKDRAIKEYARLLRVPYSGLNVHVMKRHPAFFPLQGDPRFQALLNDPKNNAPLF